MRVRSLRKWRKLIKLFEAISYFPTYNYFNRAFKETRGMKLSAEPSPRHARARAFVRIRGGCSAAVLGENAGSH
jgi:hypothetical protein